MSILITAIIFAITSIVITLVLFDHSEKTLIFLKILLSILIYLVYIFGQIYFNSGVLYCRTPQLTIDVETANSILTIKKVPAPYAEQIAHVQAGVGAQFTVEYIGENWALITNNLTEMNW